MKQAYLVQEYRSQDIMGASPLHLVIMAYDLALRACEREDFEKATRVVTALRDALDFNYPEAALGLFRVYQWCLERLREGDYHGAHEALQQLRDAWAQAEKQMMQPARTPEPVPAGSQA